MELKYIFENQKQFRVDVADKVDTSLDIHLQNILEDKRTSLTIETVEKFKTESNYYILMKTARLL